MTKPAVAKPPRPAKVAPGKTSSREVALKLLRRAEGASLAELTKATGWQPHSARAVICARQRSRLGRRGFFFVCTYAFCGASRPICVSREGALLCLQGAVSWFLAWSSRSLLSSNSRSVIVEIKPCYRST